MSSSRRLLAGLSSLLCFAASLKPCPLTEPKEGNVPRSPLLFYCIDTVADVGKPLRAASRRSWLPAARSLGDEYRFFGFDMDKLLEGSEEEECDFVRVPSSHYSTYRWTREFRIVSFALRWGLRHSRATYVAKADHDVFVCAGHLHHALADRAAYPTERFFMGDFYMEMGWRCRADQCFLIYSRDVLTSALDYLVRPLNVTFYLSHVKKREPRLNWAMTWRTLMRYWWLNENLAVYDVPMLFDSHQGMHGTKARATGIPNGYCRRKFGLHVSSKDTEVFDAIMRKGGAVASNYSTPSPAEPPCLSWPHNCCPCDAWPQC